MQLLTAEIKRRLLANNAATLEAQKNGTEEPDHIPVVKFFDPTGAATWLIIDIDSEDEDRMFGLCDLGMGCPELGYVCLSELQGLRGRGGIGIERDIVWTAKHPLSIYADAARSALRIIDYIPETQTKEVA